VAKRKSFYETITEAVADIVEHGFDSEERLDKWMKAIEASATSALPKEELLEKALRDGLIQQYDRLVKNGAIFEHHPGVSKFTIKQLTPKMRDELDKRIMASAKLIKLNRKQAVAQTLQRFAGWTTSIPAGGTKQADKAKVKGNFRKALTRLPFEERRLLIDQGHKLIGAINEVVATETGAIAMIWHSHWREPGYDYREDHKDRDEKVFVLKNSWARDKGYVKAGEHGFYDDITKVNEEPFCRCYAQWIYAIRDLPEDCVTAKGRAALEDARAKIKAM
jgi:hypothetical protein